MGNKRPNGSFINRATAKSKDMAKEAISNLRSIRAHGIDFRQYKIEQHVKDIKSGLLIPYKSYRYSYSLLDTDRCLAIATIEDKILGPKAVKLETETGEPIGTIVKKMRGGYLKMLNGIEAEIHCHGITSVTKVDAYFSPEQPYSFKYDSRGGRFSTNDFLTAQTGHWHGITIRKIEVKAIDDKNAILVFAIIAAAAEYEYSYGG